MVRAECGSVKILALAQLGFCSIIPSLFVTLENMQSMVRAEYGSVIILALASAQLYNYSPRHQLIIHH